MNLQAVVDFLEPKLTAAAPGPAWKVVRKARNAEDFIGEAGDNLPVALVHHWRTEGGEVHGMDMAFRQTTVDYMAVVIVCREDELEQRRDELFDALAGEEIDAISQHLFAYDSGQIFELKAQVCAYREIFRVQRTRTKTGA